ncbi:MAG: hypothetical protein U0359_24845 [Byssovorax sp.]
MSRSARGLACALLLAACGGAERARPPGHSPPRAGPAPVPAGARIFLGAPDDVFWVSRGEAGDRVIAGAARMEVSADGEVLAAAWEPELSQQGEGLAGAIALPAEQGGGFVAWSRRRVFRAASHTGPLMPVGPDLPGLRGARVGLRGAVLVTEAGLLELLPGAAALTPFPAPAIQDLVAIGPSRSLRLDVFGRVSASNDGGRMFRDLSPIAGTAVRALGLGERDLLIETWQGRFAVGEDGALTAAEGPAAEHETFRSFQAPRPARPGSAPPGYPARGGETSPLEAAVYGGARLPDGTAFGLVQGALVQVDLRTGRALAGSASLLAGGLGCELVPEPRGSLVTCQWERFQGDGAYVLSAEGTAAPALEKSFSGEGTFVADDEGALGFTGACATRPRPIDPDDPSRFEQLNEPTLGPVFCARSAGAEGRAPAWIEHRIDLEPGAKVMAWVPRRDGTATALVLPGDPLPPPERDPGPVRDLGRTRIVRLPPAPEGFGWARSSVPPSLHGTAARVDRRFHARADGSIAGWITPVPEALSGVVLGVTIDPSGAVAPHDLPPSVASMVTTGDHGLAVGKRGALFETVDHGRRWAEAGLSPIAPASVIGGGCSALGCVMGPIIRLGWGPGALRPIIDAEPLARPEPRSGAPRLACAPRGLPAPRWVAPPGPSGARQTLSTGYGDTLELVRDLAASEPAGSPGPSGGAGIFPLPPMPAPAGSPKKPRPGSPRAPASGSPAVLRTHTLILRPPFEPTAGPRRLNATDAALTLQRRAQVTPLLTPEGEVGLLLAGETSELLVVGDKISPWPGFEARRSSFVDTPASAGLFLPGGHALVIGEIRRRISIEEHRPEGGLPPILIGADRDSARRHPLTLGRRDDGAIGVLVIDGITADTASVAPLDRRTGDLGAIVPLAPWSSLRAADDPRCQTPEPEAYRALVILDPSAWIDLDEASLPGVALAKQGIALVRWGPRSVCAEALDLGATDARRRGDGARALRLIARWDEGRATPKGDPARAALRAADLVQEISCAITSAR